MSRTLQEGVLTTHPVFQCRDAFAVVRILHVVVEKMRHNLDSSFFRIGMKLLFGVHLDTDERSYMRLGHDRSPLAADIADDLLSIVKASFDIQPLTNYSRTPVSLGKTCLLG